MRSVRVIAVLLALSGCDKSVLQKPERPVDTHDGIRYEIVAEPSVLASMADIDRFKLALRVTNVSDKPVDLGPDFLEANVPLFVNGVRDEYWESPLSNGAMMLVTGAPFKPGHTTDIQQYYNSFSGEMGIYHIEMRTDKFWVSKNVIVTSDQIH